MRNDLLFDQVIVPESMLFGYPSRISNIYEPVVESIIQKSLIIPSEKITVSVEHSVLLPSYLEVRKVGVRDKILLFNERRKFGSIENLGERLVYDARYVYNNNITHLIQHHLAALGFMKKELGVTRENVVVLFEGNAPKLAIEIMRFLGYEVLSTSRRVSCNSIQVKVDPNNFFHLLSYVKYVEFSISEKSFPDKIFISRLNTRKLINEDEVDNFLCCQGYEKVYFEGLSFGDQWAMMMNASNVIAIHGAALGALAFSGFGNKKISLIELFSPGLVVNSFRKYVAILNGSWVGCRGEITPKMVRDIDIPGKAKSHAFEDFKISIKSIEEAINY